MIGFSKICLDGHIRWRMAQRRAMSSRSRRLTAEHLEERRLLASDVLITEWMAVNGTSPVDNFAETSDWIEIHNSGEEHVNLNGWKLTDDPADLEKWGFPEHTIDPGGYLVVFASGRNLKPVVSRLTRDFHATPDATFVVDLPSGLYDVRVRLGDAALARDEMEIHVQGQLLDTVSTDVDEYAVRTAPTEVLGEAGSQLIIRIRDNGGQTRKAVINELVLTPTAGGKPLRFDFGERDSPLEPGYQRVTESDTYSADAGFGWSAGSDVVARDRATGQDQLHTNFRLSASGEYLGLMSPEGEVASEFGIGGGTYPPQYSDISYGVVNAPQLEGPSHVGYLMSPTPGEANDVRTAVTGPVIRSVTENPGTIDDDEDLVITATLEQTYAPVDSVVLTYRVMYGDETRVSMVDDGSGFDRVAGDRVYTAAIPRTTSSPGDMVRWYVTALDARGYGSRAPLFSGVHFRPGWFTFRQDFSDGIADGFDPRRGTWSVTDGHYAVTPTGEGDTLSLIPVFSDPDGEFEIKAELETSSVTEWNRNGAVIFDFQDENEYKFAMLDMDGQQVAIGQNDGHGRAIVASSARPLVPDRVYDLRVVLNGSVVSMWVDGILRVEHDFRAPVDDGLVGFGSQAGAFWMDNVRVGSTVGTDLESPEYFGTVVADQAVDSALPVLHWFVEDSAAAETEDGTFTSMYFLGRFYDNIHVDLHGQSTAGPAFPKKSFDVDFNPERKFTFAEDQPPISDFNLLTNYADKTKLRNTLAYETYRDAGHAHHVAFPVRVQRNGEFFSIHDWVGEAGKDYLERLGLDPEGALYKVNNPLLSTSVGVEKRTRTYEDRSDLQELVDSWQLPAADRDAWFFDNLDIASWVNFLAAMPLTGNIDCCAKNFYVYRDSVNTGLWQILPWDVDLSFGHNFETNKGYFDETIVADSTLFQGNAVIFRLYEAPGFREMYLRRLRTLIDQLLQPPDTPQNERKYEARIDELIAQLGNDAVLNQAAWGFPDLFTPQTPLEAAEEMKRLYLQARREFLYDHYNETAAVDRRIPDAQLGFPEIEVGAVESLPTSGNVDEQFIRLDNPNGFAVDISNWRLTGDIDFTFRSGTVVPAGGALYVVADVPAFLGRSEGPRGGQGLFIQGEFSGRLSKDGTEVTVVPYHPGPSPEQRHLRITELNYNPYDALQEFGDLRVDNDRFEFVELLNTGTETLELEHVTFTDGIEFTFGEYQLSGGQRTLVVRDRIAFESRYGTGLPIAGEFASGKLSNGGEQIRLEDSRGDLIVDFIYGDSTDWPRLADGSGATLEVIDTDSDFSDAANWRNSMRYGGTPADAALDPPIHVIVNEVQSRGTGGGPDWIELHNAADDEVDISGWYLGDDRDDLLQWGIPTDSPIPSGGYRVIEQTEFGFGLSGTRGDSLWLLASDANGKPIWFADHVEFNATDQGISLGRWPNGHSEAILFPMASPSHGLENAGPLTGAVIVSEVHYHPLNDLHHMHREVLGSHEELEFVEIINTTHTAIDLTGWRIVGGVTMAFAAGQSIGPGETRVMVGFDPMEKAKADAFRGALGIDGSVPLWGPYVGQLTNSGGIIRLIKPVIPDNPPYAVLVDHVSYDDQWPWPSLADGQGWSLGRGSVDAFGNIGSSWAAIEPSPGTSTAARKGDSNFDGVVDGSDMAALVSILRNAAAYRTAYGEPATSAMDIDNDADVDFDDIDDFRELFYSEATAAALVTPNVENANDVTWIVLSGRDGTLRMPDEASQPGSDFEQRSIDSPGKHRLQRRHIKQEGLSMAIRRMPSRDDAGLSDRSGEFVDSYRKGRSASWNILADHAMETEVTWLDFPRLQRS